MKFLAPSYSYQQNNSDITESLNASVKHIRKLLEEESATLEKQASRKSMEEKNNATINADSFFKRHYFSLINDTIDFFIQQMKDELKPPYKRPVLVFQNEKLSYNTNPELNEKHLLEKLIIAELSSYFDSDVVLSVQCACPLEENRVLVGIDLSFA
ncbi:MAG: hypothetical protein J6A04_06400 [Clostridia bacterium]|nr:hypothetical protein [Clostridia bacterium]